MKLDRQDYKDSTYEEARQKGYDTLQLKYDGWWARVEISDGTATIFSRTNRLVVAFATQPGISGVFVGEYLFGTQWSQRPDRQGKIYLFDVWRSDNTNLDSYSYRDRHAILKSYIPQLGHPFNIVPNFSIHAFDEIWKTQVLSGEFEGVVFRRRLGTMDDLLLRSKASFTEEVQIVGFVEGEGKHQGRLGSLACRTRAGVEISVGGGFDDGLRESIWANQTTFLGRWLTIEGKARFESGALRHPNFKEWRPDLES